MGESGADFPEAPVQVVDLIREDLRLGGTGNVANNLVATGCSVSVCSVIASDENGNILRRVFANKGINIEGVFEDPTRTTTKKTRIFAANQQIVRIDKPGPGRSACQLKKFMKLSIFSDSFIRSCVSRNDKWRKMEHPY